MEVGTGSASEARGRSLRTLNRRLVGLIFLIGGLGLAKWQIYDPLHARELGRKEVWIDAKLVGLAIILPALGALFLVFGERVEGLLRSGWLRLEVARGPGGPRSPALRVQGDRGARSCRTQHRHGRACSVGATCPHPPRGSLCSIVEHMVFSCRAVCCLSFR